MTREQHLFSAARHLLDLHPVERVNSFQSGTQSHRNYVALIDAEDDLITALAAYEGSTQPSPATSAGEAGRRPDEGQPAKPFNNGTR